MGLPKEVKHEIVSKHGASQTDTSTRTRGSAMVWFCTLLCASRSFGTWTNCCRNRSPEPRRAVIMPRIHALKSHDGLRKAGQLHS